MKNFLTLLLCTSLFSFLHAQVQFCVDMSCSGLTPDEVSVFGGTAGFENTFPGTPLADDDGDGVWCGMAAIAVDDSGNADEYLFVADEQVESFAVDAPCTVTFDGGPGMVFTNRLYTGGSSVSFRWESCDTACPADAGAGTVIPGATATAAVPTMSEWGLMIFFLLVMNLSLVFLRRLELVRAH